MKLLRLRKKNRHRRPASTRRAMLVLLLITMAGRVFGQCARQTGLLAENPRTRPCL